MRTTRLTATPIMREANLVVALEAEEAHHEIWSDPKKKFDVAGVLPFLPDITEVHEQPQGRSPIVRRFPT